MIVFMTPSLRGDCMQSTKQSNPLNNESYNEQTILCLYNDKS